MDFDIQKHSPNQLCYDWPGRLHSTGWYRAGENAGQLREETTGAPSGLE